MYSLRLLVWSMMKIVLCLSFGWNREEKNVKKAKRQSVNDICGANKKRAYLGGSAFCE